jgi:hypothetical protein
MVIQGLEHIFLSGSPIEIANIDNDPSNELWIPQGELELIPHWEGTWLVVATTNMVGTVPPPPGGLTIEAYDRNSLVGGASTTGLVDGFWENLVILAPGNINRLVVRGIEASLDRICFARLE